MNYDLNEKNFLILTMKAYDKPNYVLSEYEADIARIKYIKKLIRKYKNKKILKERLILNHIIILSNVFGVELTVKILFYSLEPEFYSILVPFLLYLNYLPPVIKFVKGKTILISDISLDQIVINTLRKI